MTDYKDAIEQLDSTAPILATTSLDHNPDDGARALQLSRATGAPPLTVYDDLDGFESDHRAALTAGIVRNNDRLAAYLRGNPLADVVSNDDYGNLDNFTRTAQGVMAFYDHVNPVRAFVRGTIETFKEAGTAPLAEAIEKTGSPLVGTAMAAPMQILGMLSAPIGGAQEVARLAGEVSGDTTGGEQLARDIGGMFESEMMRIGEHPTGTHPEIDAAKADLNAKVLGEITTNLEAAQSVLTKERDPILAETYFKQHYETASLGISGDRVLELYGDRVPAFGDGLLGWVPDLAAQLEAAKLGDDVHVPLSSWMTHVDPAVAKELMDDIRVWPGGITAREAAESREYPSVVDSPMAQARASLGTEPLFSIGDRKLELKQLPSLAGFEEFHEYQFIDPMGKPIGELTIVPNPAKKELYVANINGLAGLYSNAFGPSLIRDLKKQLKAIYPDYETITGHRVSGAREKAGTWETEVAYPKVKLSWDKVGGETDLLSDIDSFRQLLEQKGMEHFGQDIYAELLTPETMTSEMAAAGNIIAEEIERITGGLGDYALVGRIAAANMPSLPIKGVYLPRTGAILVDLFNQDARGVAHHEAIHLLRKRGVFTPEEWATLRQAVKDEGWWEKHQIALRYEHLLDVEALDEEAIAEAFRTWAQDRENTPVPSKVEAIFQKLLALWENIKARFAEKGLDANQIFDQVWSGELAQRNWLKEDAGEIKAALGEDVGGLKFSVEEDPKGKGFIAFHGTPHEFEKFDISKIGTGEGAQSYGHGLYFAEEEKVAGKYQKKLSGEAGGNLYQVKINADPAKFLDWDKPLEDQMWIWEVIPQKIRDRIDSVMDDRGMNMMSDVLEEYTGRELFQALAHYDVHEDLPPELPGSSWLTGDTTEKIHTSKFLESLGVKGIKYLDSGSRRNPQEPTRNIVVFNHDDVEITHKNGEPIKQDQPMFSIDDVREQLNHIRATISGLDKKTFENIIGLIRQSHKEDVEAAMKRAEKIQKKIQTDEWKAQEKEVRKEISERISNRPDVLADQFIGAGELGGKKIRQVNPLKADDLSEAQKAALPKHYYSKDGVPVDAAASLFGFPSGDAMVEAVINYHKTKEGRTPKEHLQATIDEAVQRQMERLYGKLDENIMSEAQDQALSETNLNLVAEEWQAAAMQAGVSVVDKDVAKAHALETFAQFKMANVDFGRLQTQMLKHYNDAVKLLVNGDPAGAVVRLQRRYELGLLAAEAKKLQKEQARFDRTAKQFSKREVPSVEPEYTNFIHDILQRVGKPVRRSIQDIAKEIEAGESKSLAEFVANKTGMFREVAVWDQLFDSAWRKPVEEMTVEEFRNVANSIKSLVFNGRDERKIYRQGEAADLAEIKKQAIEAVAESAKGEIQPDTKTKVGKILRNFYVSHLQFENILNRWDAFNPKGVWNQYVMRDLIDGANQVDAWRKEYAKRIKELPTPKNLDRSIDNPIFVDVDKKIPISFTRKNLITVMLNMGTGTGKRSNLFKLADGYGLTPEQVTAWVHSHATAEDWKFVREVWDIFADIKKRSDMMYRSLSGGVPAEDVPTFPIQTPHGTIDGGYYPIIFHKEMEGRSKKLMGRDPLEQDGYFRATTPAGYTKARTGYTAPLALDLDQMPGRIGQMLQDIGLRPAVINANKLFYDHDVRSAVRKHYGTEYKDELLAYLRGVANSANQTEKSQQALTAASEFIRQNMITTLVGLNPGTVLKHGPTAAILSMREVGPTNFAKAVASMFRVNEETAESNWQFAMKHSLELQRRDRNWEESLYGATAGLVPGEKFAPWRQKIMQWSSKPVALSDMISAVPTWLAAYEKEMGESGIHGDAVYAADRAVRRAHGSTASTNRTAIMRTANPWLTSVYNFFSDIMNRQMETIWRSGEILDRVKEGEKKAAMAAAGTVTASLFAYAVWPAIVEHMVSGQAEDQHESWAMSAGKAMVRSTASSWVGVRDFVNWMLYGFDPQLGMAGTAMKELGSAVNDLKKDHPFRKDHAGRLLQDGAGMVGALTGMMPQQIGRSGRYLYDVEHGREHPKGPWEWLVGLRYGTTKGHSRTMEDYFKGKVRR